MQYGKYFLTIYGSRREEYLRRIDKFLTDNTKHTRGENCDFYVNQIYDTGIPDEPVWEDNVGILFHGIIFPYEISIDTLAENRDKFLKTLIRKSRENFLQIPFVIKNGTYACIVEDKKKEAYYAFTSFLNSIPVYYILQNGVLIVSSNLYLVAQISESTIDPTNEGILEYYVNGTNLSERTIFNYIKSIPKGGYLRFQKGVLEVDYYYRMPVEESSLSFNEYVDEFAELSQSTMKSIHSSKFYYGLGLTGGIDSRLVLSDLPDKDVPLLFTGSFPENPDVILAKKITNSLNLHHVMEDYRNEDELVGYVKYCSMADNPTHCNSYYFSHKIKFRQSHKLVYELSGLTEFLGGVYHYSDRRSVKNAINMSLPITRHSISKFTEYEIITMGLRNISFLSDLGDRNRDIILPLFLEIFESTKKQIGDVCDVESFLERFRHIHKTTNLLKWVVLPGRVSNENISPYMNIENTDFACRINLKHRQNRKLLLAYLKRYHPELAKFVLSGYIFSAKSPWIVYKLLAHHINNLNHLGMKVPFVQPYIQKHDFYKKTEVSQKRIQEFQRSICKESSLIMETELRSIFMKYQSDTSRLMRLYNLALYDIKMRYKDNLENYLMSVAQDVINK